METKVYNQSHQIGDVTYNEKYIKIVNDFTEKVFHDENLKKVKPSFSPLRITKITNQPIVYTLSEVFFEERRGYANSAPHGYVVTNASRMMLEYEFDIWNTPCPPPSKDFTKEHNTVMIPESTFLIDCTSCGANGEVKCNNCTSGTAICPKCNGNGGWNCNRCGGNGKMICPICNGGGYVLSNEQRYDSDGRPVYDNVYVTCYNCNGYREVICSQCNGGGWFNCGTCYSSGQITCKTCNGSTRIPCSFCLGHGHFLHSVNINQVYDNYALLHLHKNSVPDEHIYEGREFSELQPHNDLLICIHIDDNPITEIPIHQILPDLFNEPLDMSEDINRMYEARNKRGNNRKHIKYRVVTFLRDILQVEYVFQNTTYYLMLDTSTGEYLMNKNPYDNVAEVIYLELKGHAEQLRFKSFFESYDELHRISSSFENLSYDMESASQYYKKINRICIVIPFLSCIVAHLLRLINGFSIRETLWPNNLFFKCIALLGPLIITCIITRFRKKIVSDKKGITFVLLAVPSAIITLLIGFLCTLAVKG